MKSSRLAPPVAIEYVYEIEKKVTKDILIIISLFERALENDKSANQPFQM